MLPHWQGAAVSPLPSSGDQRSWLMNPGRHFRTASPGGTDTGIIQGHSAGVLGHQPDAAQDWNTSGHKRPRADNLEHNRQTGTYHGIESKARSDASGASAPHYRDPTPADGSHPSHWNRSAPGFYPRAPWPTWSEVPGGARTAMPGGTASSSSSSDAAAAGTGRPVAPTPLFGAMAAHAAPSGPGISSAPSGAQGAGFGSGAGAFRPVVPSLARPAPSAFVPLAGPSGSAHDGTDGAGGDGRVAKWPRL
jgi:hypothetical protein